MDDLDPLRRLGASVPTEDAPARERARERLRSRYRSSEAMDRNRRRRASWWLGAATATVVVLLLVELLPGRTTRSGAATLDDLARIASGEDLVEIPPGKYLYVRSEELRRVAGEDLGSGNSWTALVRVTRQAWRGANGSGRILTTAGAPRFISPEDEQAWRDAGSPPLIDARSDERFEPGTFPSTPLTRFPLDPTALRRVLERRQGVVGPPGNAGTFWIIGTLLAQEQASPALRAALIRVAASLPGVHVLGRAQDPLGRPSLGVRLAAHGYDTVLHFDPRTAALLASEQRGSSDRDAANPSRWIAYQTAVLVDSMRSSTPSSPAASTRR